jgi:hypothetical protein
MYLASYSHCRRLQYALQAAARRARAGGRRRRGGGAARARRSASRPPRAAEGGPCETLHLSAALRLQASAPRRCQVPVSLPAEVATAAPALAPHRRHYTTAANGPRCQAAASQ